MNAIVVWALFVISNVPGSLPVVTPFDSEAVCREQEQAVRQAAKTDKDLIGKGVVASCKQIRLVVASEENI